MFSFIRKMDRRSKTLLFTCFFGFFCNGTLTLMIGSVLPDLKAAYDLSDTLSGLFISAHSIGNMAASFISGLIPLYLGRRRSIVLLASLAMLGFLMMALWGNPVWLFMAFVMSGMGRGSVSNFNNYTVNRISDGHPAASLLLHASFAMGAITAPLAFLLLSKLIAWRAAVIYVAAAVTLGVFFYSRMRLTDDMPDRQDKRNRSLSFVKEPAFIVLALMMFCYVCSEYAINGWLVTYIQNKGELLSSFNEEGEALKAAVRSYSQTMATLLWAVMFIGRLLCAGLSSRVGQKKLMLISSAGIVVFFMLMLSGRSIAVVSMAIAGLGLCMAGISPMIYSDAALYSNTFPLATSVILVTGSIGGVLMPAIVGALADSVGFGGGMSAIMISVVLLAVLSFINTVIKKK